MSRRNKFNQFPIGAHQSSGTAQQPVNTLELGQKNTAKFNPGKSFQE